MYRHHFARGTLITSVDPLHRFPPRPVVLVSHYASTRDVFNFLIWGDSRARCKPWHNFRLRPPWRNSQWWWFLFTNTLDASFIRRKLYKKDFQRTTPGNGRRGQGSASSCALAPPFLSDQTSLSSSKCFRFPAIPAQLRFSFRGHLPVRANVWVIKFPFSAFERERLGTKQRNESTRKAAFERKGNERQRTSEIFNIAESGWKSGSPFSSPGSLSPPFVLLVQPPCPVSSFSPFSLPHLQP